MFASRRVTRAAFGARSCSTRSRVGRRMHPCSR
jgi:hypothetical protein